MLRLRDPASYAHEFLYCKTVTQLTDLFRECQAEALIFGRHVGQDEFLKIAVDTDARVRQLTTVTTQHK